MRVKFIDFFAGIGGFRRGMELAEHECVGFCEFDKFATASYISMHLLTDEQRKRLNELPQKKRQKEILKDEYRNGEWYANDVRRVCADDIPKADCWCFGFPCFTKGTYILTERGYIPIEQVIIGDRVLTHSHGRESAMVQAFDTTYMAWEAWDHIRRLTCLVCGVRYVRQLEGNPDAERICDEICQKIYDLRISVSEKK